MVDLFDLRTGPRVPQQRQRPKQQALPNPSGRSRALPASALAVDVLAVALTVVAAGLGRNLIPSLAPQSSGYGTSILIVAPILAVAWLIVIAACGGYDVGHFGAGPDEYRRVALASLITGAAVGIGCYLTQFPLSRGFFALVVLLGPCALLLARFALRHVVRRTRRRGGLSSRVLVVGDSRHVNEVSAVLKRESWLGYDVVGALVSDAEQSPTSQGIPVLGPVDDIVSQAADADADAVFFAGGSVRSSSQLRETLYALERDDTQVIVAPSLTDVSHERVRIRPVGGLPLLHVEKPRSASAGRRAKRIFDVLGSLTLIFVTLPFFLFASVKIRRFDTGPVLFRQERIGRDGRPFTCLKFRTMAVDAEQRLKELLEDAGMDFGVFAKLQDDPRITKPGRWLRRLSLDELPQLFNVLRGDMSLVGPRPQVADEVAMYEGFTSRRLHVRPGMTGLWQVSGRSDLSITEAVRLDLYYVDNWSMLQDLSILARTTGAVLGSRGAY